MCLEAHTIVTGENNRAIKPGGRIFSHIAATCVSFFKTDILAARFEWGVIAFGCGIIAYFSWPHEPGMFAALGLLAVLFIALVVIRNHITGFDMLILVFLGVLGFSRAILHTYSTAAPILPQEQKFYQITGWVERAQQSKTFRNFYIRVDNVQGLSAEKTPKIIRIRSKPHDVRPGDMIRINAMVSAPPGPAIVGGYDSARASFFRQIGGYGFAVSKPVIIEHDQFSVGEKIRRQIVLARYALSRHIQARAPPRTSGLQAALLTGDRSAIPNAQAQALRDAGLAHLLAISGLHMGLLAGGVFFISAMLFSFIGPLARRYDMRKPAACVGALLACVYLVLSGASISTQRAFIMAIVMFSAVIMDRRAVSIRSVTLAAAITLMLHPESLLSAGFQMSFSATLALVAVYGQWTLIRTYSPDFGWRSKFKRGFIGLSVTSLVAGAATGGFAALHFHRIARYGFFANIAAMSVFTVIVMPAGFIAVLLIPLGLDIYALKIMGMGLDVVLAVATWISAQKGALAYVKSANGLVVALYGLGLIWVCLGPKRIRLAGIGVLFATLVIWISIKPPDMRISQKARIAFWHADTAHVLQVDRKRGDGFGRARFMEQAGLTNAEVSSYFDTSALCDMVGCRIDLKGKTISVIHSPEGVVQACMDSDLVVLTSERKAGPRTRHLCAALLLDMEDLQTHGARDIRVTASGLTIRRANPKARKLRPWGG